MNIQSAPRHDDIAAIEPISGISSFADLLGEAWSIWQIPLVTALSWWGEAIDAQRHDQSQPIGADGTAHEHHNELIVPDILEEDDEHALFA